ncbi:MAG: hypothetical protein WC867_08555 [Candidatus Pacearchaeota archaeon]|jgi:tetratricopeptide (TPR) repeat protein
MQVFEKTRGEIEARASKMSDFLKMEYLESCLKKLPDIEIHRFCYQELSKLYEKNHMYPDAIKYIINFQEITISRREKINAFLREIELLIKGGYYDRVDYSYKKLNENMNEKELYDVEIKIKEFYKTEIKNLERSNRYAPLLKAYEKLVKLTTGEEKIEMKKKILFLYRKLGKVRESIELERELGLSHERAY